MTDTLDTGGAAKQLLVDGRNPTAGETITVDPTVLQVSAPDANGAVFVNAIADGDTTITVDPDADDVAANKSTGTDEVISTTPAAPPTPLAVTLV